MRIILLAAAASAILMAQTKSPWADLAFRQKQVLDNVAKSAAKMPEESWAFRPSHDVRTFEELVHHVAGANFMFCSAAESKPNPGGDKIKAAKGKAAVSALLADSQAYCSQVYAALESGAVKSDEVVKFLGGSSRAGVLMLNTAHNFEHYGNIVTYLRIRGFVPPSSER